MPRLRGTLAPVFWPRARAKARRRTCDLNRSPRYAFGRERALQGARSHGAKILGDHRATGEKSGLDPLQFDKPAITTRGIRHQRVVAIVIHHPAVFEEYDAVCPSDGGETVGDDDD